MAKNGKANGRHRISLNMDDCSEIGKVFCAHIQKHPHEHTENPTHTHHEPLGYASMHV